MSDAIELAGVRLTSPDKLLFPKVKITKQRLAEYYVEVADRILPWLGGRPVSLVRCPEGEDAECFFQRHPGRGLPDAIHAIDIPERSTGDRPDYMMIDDLAGLLGAVQIGTLELHVWGARADALERPERLVFDLDPDEELEFGEVRRAAAELHEFLEELGLTSFPLATGGKGVHVVVPIQRRWGWPVVKAFARGVAEAMAAAAPARFTTNIRKQARAKRIFLDYLRNERGSTAICPWSSRAKQHAPVAMPVSWEELATLDRPDRWTVMDAAGRLELDPWPGYRKLRQGITRKAAAKLDAA